MRVNLISSIIMLLFFSNFAKSQESEGVKCKIEGQNFEGLFMVKSVATNNSNVYQSLNYTLLAVKKGKTGNMSSNKQGGKFTLEPRESKELSTISISLEKNDGLKVFLFVKDDKTDKLITKDSLEINSAMFSNNYENKNKDEDDIKLQGLTIDETKTRFGSEFYGKLYNLMMLNSLKFDFIIKVMELPSLGKNTVIQVFADDNSIFSFIPKPDDESMENAVQQTLASLFNYEKQKNVADKGFIY